MIFAKKNRAMFCASGLMVSLGILSILGAYNVLGEGAQQPGIYIGIFDQVKNMTLIDFLGVSIAILSSILLCFWFMWIFCDIKIKWRCNVGVLVVLTFLLLHFLLILAVSVNLTESLHNKWISMYIIAMLIEIFLISPLKNLGLASVNKVRKGRFLIFNLD